MANLLDIHSRQLEDFHQFREKSSQDSKDKQQETDNKFILMSKEMQTVKSQIYYLQQSVLQLRGALKNTEGDGTDTLQGGLHSFTFVYLHISQTFLTRCPSHQSRMPISHCSA